MSEHIQRALARDPRHVEARPLIASTPECEGERKALFEALTRDAPQDYRGWLGLATLQQGAEARTAVERAVELAPRQARAWLARAQYEWNSGDRAAGLQSDERALRLQPTNLSALTLYAEMPFHDGRCRAMGGPHPQSLQRGARAAGRGQLRTTADAVEDVRWRRERRHALSAFGSQFAADPRRSAA